MRICVFGVGGVGGYFGGRLASSGNSVTFIARGATLDALRRDGLRVESPLGDIDLPTVEATDNPAEVGEVDVAILGVKAWQVPEVAEEIRSMLIRAMREVEAVAAARGVFLADDAVEKTLTVVDGH